MRCTQLCCCASFLLSCRDSLDLLCFGQELGGTAAISFRKAASPLFPHVYFGSPIEELSWPARMRGASVQALVTLRVEASYCRRDPPGSVQSWLSCLRPKRTASTQLKSPPRRYSGKLSRNIICRSYAPWTHPFLGGSPGYRSRQTATSRPKTTRACSGNSTSRLVCTPRVYRQGSCEDPVKLENPRQVIRQAKGRARLDLPCGCKRYYVLSRQARRPRSTTANVGKTRGIFKSCGPWDEQHGACMVESSCVLVTGGSGR